MEIEGVEIKGVMVETVCSECEGSGTGSAILRLNAGNRSGVCAACAGSCVLVRGMTIDMFREIVLKWVEEKWVPGDD